MGRREWSFFPFPLPAGVPLTFLLLKENVKYRKAKRAQGAQCSLLSFCVGCGVSGMAAQVLPLVMKSSSIKDRTCSLVLGQGGK